MNTVKWNELLNKLDVGVDEMDDPYPDVDEDEDYVDALDDHEFIDGASSSFPFQLTIPANLNEVLNQDAKGPCSDSDGSYKNKLWSTVWPNVTPDTIDPAQAAADYYLLFGLVNNSFVEFEEINYPTAEEIQKAGDILGADQVDVDNQIKLAEEKTLSDPRFKLTELAKQADVLYHNLVTRLDKCFREYVHLACGGELRHHQACNGSMGSYRRGAWVKWHYIYEQNGPDALLKMAELFEEFTGGSYGGPPWANAARILHQRELGELGPDDFTNKQLFVDRVFTLEHNGGCFLNKLDWINLRKHREPKYARHFVEMKDYVLNAHASNPTNIDMLLGYASQDIIDLTLKYFKIANDNDIEIVGNWAGKKTVTKPLTESTTIKPSPVESGVIDWSDMDGKVTTDTKDSLLEQLEKSLINHQSLNKHQSIWANDVENIDNDVISNGTYKQLGKQDVTWKDFKTQWVD